MPRQIAQLKVGEIEIARLSNVEEGQGYAIGHFFL